MIRPLCAAAHNHGTIDSGTTGSSISAGNNISVNNVTGSNLAAGNEINATGSLVGVNITAGNNINAQASVQGGKLNAANNMTIAGNATKSVLTAGNQLTVQGIATDNQLQATSYAIAQEEGKNTRIAQRDATVSPSTESRNLSDLLGVLATALVEAARAAEVQKQADKGGPK